MQQRPWQVSRTRKADQCHLFLPAALMAVRPVSPWRMVPPLCGQHKAGPETVEGADWYGGSMGQAASQCPRLTSCQTLGRTV